MPLDGKVSKKPPATPITQDRCVGFKTDDPGEWQPRMFESVWASPHQYPRWHAYLVEASGEKPRPHVPAHVLRTLKETYAMLTPAERCKKRWRIFREDGIFVRLQPNAVKRLFSQLVNIPFVC